MSRAGCVCDDCSRFELGAYRGDFTRIESRFAVLDPLYAASRGKSSFTVEGPGVEGSIAARNREPVNPARRAAAEAASAR